MSEFSNKDTAQLAPIAESIQPLFNAIIASYIPRGVATGIDQQLVIGYLIIGLNSQLASILAVAACNLEPEESLSLRGAFYEIGASVQVTIAQSVADLVIDMNRKQHEGN